MRGDCAASIVLAAKPLAGAELVNLSSGMETSLRDPVRHITALTSFRG
jgi:hypothetical protein